MHRFRTTASLAVVLTLLAATFLYAAPASLASLPQLPAHSVFDGALPRETHPAVPLPSSFSLEWKFTGGTALRYRITHTTRFESHTFIPPDTRRDIPAKQSVASMRIVLHGTSDGLASVDVTPDVAQQTTISFNGYHDNGQLDTPLLAYVLLTRTLFPVIQSPLAIGGSVTVPLSLPVHYTDVSGAGHRTVLHGHMTVRLAGIVRIHDDPCARLDGTIELSHFTQQPSSGLRVAFNNCGHSVAWFDLKQHCFVESTVAFLQSQRIESAMGVTGPGSMQAVDSLFHAVLDNPPTGH